MVIIDLPEQIKKIPDLTIHLSTNFSLLTFTSDVLVLNFDVTLELCVDFMVSAVTCRSYFGCGGAAWLAQSYNVAYSFKKSFSKELML